MQCIPNFLLLYSFLKFDFLSFNLHVAFFGVLYFLSVLCGKNSSILSYTTFFKNYSISPPLCNSCLLILQICRGGCFVSLGNLFLFFLYNRDYPLYELRWLGVTHELANIDSGDMPTTLLVSWTYFRQQL